MMLGKSKSDRYGTPDNIMAAVYSTLGDRFELDPCADPHFLLSCDRYYTIADDALAHNWVAKSLFMNPPFSKVKPFVNRLIAEFCAGRVKEAIALTKNDSRTAWWWHCMRTCSAYCIVEGYVTFKGQPASAGFPIILWHWSAYPTKFCHFFGALGHCYINTFDGDWKFQQWIG